MVIGSAETAIWFARSQNGVRELARKEAARLSIGGCWCLTSEGGLRRKDLGRSWKMAAAP